MTMTMYTMRFNAVVKETENGKEAYTLDGKKIGQDVYQKHIQKMSELCPEEQEDMLKQYRKMRIRINNAKSALLGEE